MNFSWNLSWLQSQDEHLRMLIAGNAGRFEFSKPEHARQLNCAILKWYFGFSVRLPENHLLAPVSARLAYVDLCNEIVKLSHRSFCANDVVPERYPMNVVDIGCGPIPIFPLLAVYRFPHGRVWASDINEDTMAWAARNLDHNPHVRDQITLLWGHQQRLLVPEIPALEPIQTAGVNIDYVITNPPFYDPDVTNEWEFDHSLEDKLHANYSELYHPGGEVAWVCRLFHESLDEVTPFRVKWFTSMVAFERSVQQILQFLHWEFQELGKAQGSGKTLRNYFACPLNVSATGRARRWVVGWSFDNYRLPNRITRGLCQDAHFYGSKSWLAEKTTESFQAADCRLEPSITPEHVGYVNTIGLCQLWDALTECGGDVLFLNEAHSLVVGFRETFWDRQHRRKRKRDEDHAAAAGQQARIAAKPVVEQLIPGLYCLVVKFTWLPSENRVEVRHMYGVNVSHFTSFCGAYLARFAQHAWFSVREPRPTGI